jgi:hypothetical protein
MYTQSYDNSQYSGDGYDSDDGIFLQKNQVPDAPPPAQQYTPTELVRAPAPNISNSIKPSKCACSVGKSHFNTGCVEMKATSFLNITLTIKDIMEIIILVMIVVLISMQYKRNRNMYMMYSGLNRMQSRTQTPEIPDN